MGKADRLSRRPDWKVGTENDNDNQVLLKCYELKSLGLNNRTTLVLSNTRELNRDPFTN